MKHPLAPLVKRFFSHYLPIQKGLSSNTIEAYRDAIRLLICYTSDSLKKPADELLVEDISETIVLDFLDHLEQTRGCSPKTRNARLAAIRGLFAFVGRVEPVLLTQCHQIRSIPLKRAEHKTVNYLEEEEMQAIVDAVDLNSRTGIRDLALILLLYNTGARVSEIVTLELDGLRLETAPKITLLGKGNKIRTCPLWPETVVALKDYLNQRHPRTHTERVFVNANGSPITRYGIRYITRKYGLKASSVLPSITPVNPHTIRHTTAMHLLRAGNDINMVSYWLGHANINTTHVYLEIDMKMKQEMISKAQSPSITNPPPWQKPDIIKWLTALTKGKNYVEKNTGLIQ